MESNQDLANRTHKQSGGQQSRSSEPEGAKAGIVESMVNKIGDMVGANSEPQKSAASSSHGVQATSSGQISLVDLTLAAPALD